MTETQKMNIHTAMIETKVGDAATHKRMETNSGCVERELCVKKNEQNETLQEAYHVFHITLAAAFASTIVDHPLFSILNQFYVLERIAAPKPAT